MDVTAIRQAAPLFYGAVLVLTLFFARAAFLPVLIGGAVLLALLLVLTGSRAPRRGGKGRGRPPGR